MSADILLADAVIDRDLLEVEARALVDSIRESFRSMAATPRRAVAAPSQHVYFIRQGWLGPIKIGIAADPRRRLADIQTSNPFELRLLGVVRDGGRRLERELHARLAPDALMGEWFSPTDAVLAAVPGGAR